MLGLSDDDADRKPAFPNHCAATRLAGDVALASPAGGVGRALARPCQRQSTTADAGRRRLARRGRQSGGGLHRTSSVLAFCCCGGGVRRHLEPGPRAPRIPRLIVVGSDRRAWAARLGRLGVLASLPSPSTAGLPGSVVFPGFWQQLLLLLPPPPRSPAGAIKRSLISAPADPEPGIGHEPQLGLKISDNACHGIMMLCDSGWQNRGTIAGPPTCRRQVHHASHVGVTRTGARHRRILGLLYMLFRGCLE